MTLLASNAYGRHACPDKASGSVHACTELHVAADLSTFKECLHIGMHAKLIILHVHKAVSLVALIHVRSLLHEACDDSHLPFASRNPNGTPAITAANVSESTLQHIFSI